MRTISRVVLGTAAGAIAIGAGLGVAGTASAHVSPTPVSSAPVIHNGVSPSAQEWADAVNRADARTLTQLFGARTTVFPPSGAAELTGTAANVKSYTDLFATNHVSVVITEAHYFTSGAVLSSFGQSTMTIKPKAGGPATVVHVRFSDEAIRINNTATGWQYLVDHASVVPAA